MKEDAKFWNSASFHLRSNHMCASLTLMIWQTLHSFSFIRTSLYTCSRNRDICTFKSTFKVVFFFKAVKSFCYVLNPACLFVSVCLFFNNLMSLILLVLPSMLYHNCRDCGHTQVEAASQLFDRRITVKSTTKTQLSFFLACTYHQLKHKELFHYL